MADDTKTSTNSETTPNSTNSKSSSEGSSPANKPTLAEEGKSARESVGGAAVGHYGFFSNIKTPEYKSGWDDIWGKKKKNRAKEVTKNLNKTKPGETIILLKYEDLSAPLKKGLEEVVRKKLKKTSLKFDGKQHKAKFSWEIQCKVKK